MLFGNESGKLVREGDLMSSFFEKYNKIKHQYNINIGWELINKHFYKDYKTEFCKKIDLEHFYRIKFLNPPQNNPQ